MFGFYALKEERFIHRNFEFIDLKDNEGFLSPYKFHKYFYGLNYSNFTKTISELMEFNVLKEEKQYLKKFFGKKKINKLYTISTLIKKKKYSDFIENVIICKRIEFLSDYIKTQNLSQNYIDYIDNLLNSLYKTRLYLVKNIT